MKDRYEELLKKFLKRKVAVTQGLIILFMMTGQIAIGSILSGHYHDHADTTTISIGEGELAGPEGAADTSTPTGDQSGKILGATAHSIAIGGSTVVKNSRWSTVLGYKASVDGGYDTPKMNGSVALGAFSQVKAVNQGTGSQNIVGQNFDFAGGATGDTAVLSVGSGEAVYIPSGERENVGGFYRDKVVRSEAYKYRQIQNVAAGRIAADSTDAINGSQLYAAFDLISKTAAQPEVTTSGAAKLTTDKGAKGQTIYNVDVPTANLTSKTGGAVTTPSNTDADKVVTASTVAGAINTLGNNTVQLGANNGNTSQKALNTPNGIKFNVLGDNTNVVTTGDSRNNITISLKPDLSVNSLSINGGGPVINSTGIDMNGKQIIDLKEGTQDNHAVNLKQLKAYSAEAKTVVKVDDPLTIRDTTDAADQHKTYTIGVKAGEIKSTASGVASVPSQKDGLVTAQKVATAINALGDNTITLGGDKQTSSTSKALNGSTDIKFDITGDNNITTKATPNGVQVTLKPDVTVTSLTTTNLTAGPLQVNSANNTITAGPLTINNTAGNQSINAGGVTINNVGPAKVGTDAVNLNQLNAMGWYTNVGGNTGTVTGTGAENPTKIKNGNFVNFNGGNNVTIDKNVTNGVVTYTINSTVDAAPTVKYVSINETGITEEANDNHANDGAIAVGSIAVGHKTKALKNSAIAIGKEAEAKEGWSIALGSNAAAEGNSSVAIGDRAVAKNASRKDFNAIGGTGTLAAQTVAIGPASSAEAFRSVALGAGSNTKTDYFTSGSSYLTNVVDTGDHGVVSVGKVYTDSAAATAAGKEKGDTEWTRRITNVGDGIDLQDAATVNQLRNVSANITKVENSSPFHFTQQDGTPVLRGEDGKFYTPKSLEGKVYIDPIHGYVDTGLAEFKNGKYVLKNPNAPVPTNKQAQALSTAEANNVVITAKEYRPVENVASGLGLTGKYSDAGAPEALGAGETPKAITPVAAKKAVDELLVLENNVLNTVVTAMDLQAVAQAGLNFKGNAKEANSEDTVHRPLGSTLDIVGEDPNPAVTYSTKNITTTTDSKANKIHVKISETPEFKGVTVRQDGGTNVIKLDTEKGLLVGDGADSTAITITKDGINAAVKQITNVKSGLVSSDGSIVKLNEASGPMIFNAVNVGDLQAASKAATTEITANDKWLIIQQAISY